LFPLLGVTLWQFGIGRYPESGLLTRL
jgi:hypothetical protein